MFLFRKFWKPIFCFCNLKIFFENQGFESENFADFGFQTDMNTIFFASVMPFGKATLFISLIRR